VNYFDYADIVVDNDNIPRLSLSYTPQLPILESLSTSKILPEEQYRPDKVAYRLYRNPLLSWVIDEANNWYHFKDYIAGSSFYYPRTAALDYMGIDYDYESFEDENF
jgi:hypothetical protein